MIQTFDDLELKYKDYTDIKGKICRDINSGRLIAITRGLYEPVVFAARLIFLLTMLLQIMD